MQVLLAYAVARQGRRAEAAKMLEPELKYARDLVGRGSDDLGNHLLLAQALYAAAVASPANAGALLGEAAARIDAMPRDMTQRKSVARLRSQIAEEAKAAR
jgi:hypothetical protein